jgi:predicted O-methyltransferase YrrM
LSTARNPLRRVYRGSRALVLRLINALGFNVMRTGDYYSPLPVPARLRATRARWQQPSAMVGIDYDLDALRSRLSALVTAHGEEYAQLPTYDAVKTLGYGPGFTRVDAFTLYLMLRSLKPRRYVEIGSGFSTFYSARAVARNRQEGHPCQMTCIDPFPNPKLRALEGVEILAQEVQDVPVEFFSTVGEGGVLFIDSTHVVRIDGDVPYLYLEALPRLGTGAVVHVHDIHFPFNVPYPADAYFFDSKWPRYWTEAMLLQAFLSFNPAYRIELSTPLLRHFDEDFLAATLPGYQAVDTADFDTHFGSLWLRKTGSGAR